MIFRQHNSVGSKAEIAFYTQQAHHSEKKQLYYSCPFPPRQIDFTIVILIDGLLSNIGDVILRIQVIVVCLIWGRPEAII